MHEYFEKQRARIRELKNHQVELRAHELANKEMGWRIYERNKKRDKKTFIQGLSRMLLNSPLAPHVLWMAGWKRVSSIIKIHCPNRN